jgi:integrase
LGQLTSAPMSDGDMGYREIKYLERSVNRHGRERFYVRLPGHNRVRVADPAGLEEIALAFRIARGEVEAPPVARKAPATKKGTVRALLEAYAASEEYKLLDQTTRKVRRAILEGVCEEPHRDNRRFSYGECPVERLTVQDVRAIRDRKGVALPEAANGRVKALRQLFSWGIEDERANSNPAMQVRYFSATSGGHHAWTLEEVEQFEARHPVGTKPRLALALLLYLGQRRSDIVRIGPQHARDRWLTFTQEKNQRSNPVTLSLPIIDELARIIAATPTGHLAFIVTEFGKPFSANGFGNKFRDWCDQAGLEHCSAHGLRKASAARLAELGCTVKEIAAITGHQSLKEVERYTRSARQKLLARSAMRKFSAGEKKRTANDFASPKPAKPKGEAKMPPK